MEKKGPKILFTPPQSTSLSLISPDISVEALWRELLSSGNEVSPRVGLEGPLEDRKIVHIDALGRPSLISVDRHTLVHSLRLRYRDLAAVDPTLPLPTPSVILVRNRAVALNLDVGGAIRIIICENQVFVLSLPKKTDPGITALPTLDHPFVKRLCCCLAPGTASRRELQDLAAAAAAAAAADGGSDLNNTFNNHTDNNNSNKIGDLSGSSGYFDVDMPYELRAFECALTAALGILTLEINALEEWGYPAVDALIRSVDIDSLESIRKVKNTIDKLQGKVQRLLTEMGDLLRDDEDMGDLYLGKRAETQGLLPLQQPWEYADDLDNDIEEERIEEEESSVAGSEATMERERQRRRERHRDQERRERGRAMGGEETGNNNNNNMNDNGESNRRERHRRSSDSLMNLAEDMSVVDSDDASEVFLREEEELLNKSGSQSFGGGGGSGGGGFQAGARVDPHDIEEAEDLLETMFERADLLLRRLGLLDERVDDTEDFLELDLDQKRNQLVGLNLLVSSVSMAFGFTAAIGGVFGMNLSNSKLVEQGNWILFVTLAVMAVGSLILLFGVVWFVRKRRLIFIPTSI